MGWTIGRLHIVNNKCNFLTTEHYWYFFEVINTVSPYTLDPFPQPEETIASLERERVWLPSSHFKQVAWVY